MSPFLFIQQPLSRCCTQATLAHMLLDDIDVPADTELSRFQEDVMGADADIRIKLVQGRGGLKSWVCLLAFHTCTLSHNFSFCVTRCMAVFEYQTDLNYASIFASSISIVHCARNDTQLYRLLWWTLLLLLLLLLLLKSRLQSKMTHQAPQAQLCWWVEHCFCVANIIEVHHKNLPMYDIIWYLQMEPGNPHFLQASIVLTYHQSFVPVPSKPGSKINAYPCNTSDLSISCAYFLHRVSTMQRWSRMVPVSFTAVTAMIVIWRLLRLRARSSGLQEEIPDPNPCPSHQFPPFHHSFCTRSPPTWFTLSQRSNVLAEMQPCHLLCNNVWCVDSVQSKTLDFATLYCKQNSPFLLLLSCKHTPQ